jgi:predicted Zn-ribbon and HTH transcriptional regulator
MWHWILYWLASLSADPQLLEQERARTAGAVNVAYASLAEEAPAPPREPAKPAAPAACPDCNGKGYTMRSDGSRWACKCKECKSGKCPPR